MYLQNHRKLCLEDLKRLLRQSKHIYNIKETKKAPTLPSPKGRINSSWKIYMKNSFTCSQRYAAMRNLLLFQCFAALIIQKFFLITNPNPKLQKFSSDGPLISLVGTQKKLLLYFLQQPFAYLESVLISSFHLLFPALNKHNSFDDLSTGCIFWTSRSFLLLSSNLQLGCTSLEVFSPKQETVLSLSLQDVASSIEEPYHIQYTEHFYLYSRIA